ncbi:TolC family outer membrane protein [Magnetovibrio sp. PR-2]|uniref:TolC family outer membrane protein n=1 Tax=Magnetovibrio sp. PR-2 TaxID=3120356 RepID=UPI002FCE107E
MFKNTVSRLALVSAALLAVSPASAETLQEALSKAYATNPSLQSARATLRATDEGVAQAISGWRPSLSVEAYSSVKNQETNTSSGKVNTNPKYLGLTLSQSIYAGGTTMAGIEAAESDVYAQRARLVTQEQTVLLNAASAYLNVLRDQAVLELNVKNEEVLSSQLDATRDRFNVGEITRTDVHQAESRLAGATADRIQAEGDLKTSRATYANLIGDAPATLDTPILALPLPESLEDALALAETNNPSVIAADFDYKSASADINSNKGELLPSLDLSGTASRSLETASKGYWANAAEAKLTLSVPLYQSGSVYSQLRAARQTAAASRLDLDQTRRDVAEEVRTAWETLASTQARIEAIKSQVLAAETALEGVQREASVGSRTVLDVLDAEQELLDARVNLVKSQRDETVAELTLLSSIGNLTAANMNLAVDFYDAQGHYQDVRNKWFGGRIEDDGSQ